MRAAGAGARPRGRCAHRRCPSQSRIAVRAGGTARTARIVASRARATAIAERRARASDAPRRRRRRGARRRPARRPASPATRPTPTRAAAPARARSRHAPPRRAPAGARAPATSATSPFPAGRRARRRSPPRRAPGGTGGRAPRGRRSSSARAPSSSASRRSCARAAVSGDGAASPEIDRRGAAARAPARRPADRRRLRASFATICSSQGRNGAPSRKRPSARYALTKRVLDGLLGVVAVAGGDERDPERDPLVHAYELLVGGRVAALRARDERLLVRWSAPHSPLLHRGAAPRFR